MIVTNGVGTVTRLYIEGAKALDPITVFMEDFRPGVGRVSIICWGRAWSAFWNGMGGKSVSQFMLRTDDDYIAGNLWGGQKHTKADSAYLLRIVNAVKLALADQADSV